MSTILVAIVTPPATGPDWAAVVTAISTALLAAVTFAAVFYGARAAKSAADTYRLESEPVITIRQIPFARTSEILQQFVPIDYLITTNEEPGIELRPLTHSEAAQSVGKSGMERPFILLEVSNIGRSPALNLRLPCCANVPHMSRERMLNRLAGNRSTQDQYLTTTQDVVFLGIAANSPAYVRVFNDFGLQAKLDPLGVGAISFRNDPNRLTEITVLSSGPFVIVDPTHWQAMKRHSAAPPDANQTS